MGLREDMPVAYKVAKTLRDTFGEKAAEKAAEMEEFARKNDRQETLRDISLAAKMLATGVW